jgi:hypothetical protein
MWLYRCYHLIRISKLSLLMQQRIIQSTKAAGDTVTYVGERTNITSILTIHILFDRVPCMNMKGIHLRIISYCSDG